MDEDLELKMLRLRMMRKLMAARGEEKGGEEGKPTLSQALKILKEHLVERGDEILDAALQQYPEAAKKVAIILAQKVKEGRLRGDISGPALLALFESLGMRVRLETSILYYKKGEYKPLRELLRE